MDSDDDDNVVVDVGTTGTAGVRRYLPGPGRVRNAAVQ